MSQNRYVAFLLGINIGRHKRVPMTELRQMCEEIGFENVRTLLASGNVLFESGKRGVDKLAHELEVRLRETFGFEVGVIVRTMADLKRLVEADPFKQIAVTKDTRLYLTFITKEPAKDIATPLAVEDKRGAAFTILKVADRTVFSVVELGKSKTTEAMSILAKMFGKKITTRNWNTILRLVD